MVVLLKRYTFACALVILVGFGIIGIRGIRRAQQSNQALAVGLSDDNCCEPGCPVWHHEAKGQGCGDRIGWLTKYMYFSYKHAKMQVASEFPDQCGACSVESTPSQQDCCHVGCTTWNREVSGKTCGARIIWMQQHKRMSFLDAKTLVANTFSGINECGVCAHATDCCYKGCPTWNREASNGKSCGSLILSHHHNNFSLGQAKIKVAEEFSAACGVCGSEERPSSSNSGTTDSNPDDPRQQTPRDSTIAGNPTPAVTPSDMSGNGNSQPSSPRDGFTSPNSQPSSPNDGFNSPNSQPSSPMDGFNSPDSGFGDNAPDDDFDDMSFSPDPSVDNQPTGEDVGSPPDSPAADQPPSNDMSSPDSPDDQPSDTGSPPDSPEHDQPSSKDIGIADHLQEDTGLPADVEQDEGTPDSDALPDALPPTSAPDLSGDELENVDDSEEGQSRANDSEPEEIDGPGDAEQDDDDDEDEDEDEDDTTDESNQTKASKSNSTWSVLKPSSWFSRRRGSSDSEQPSDGKPSSENSSSDDQAKPEKSKNASADNSWFRRRRRSPEVSSGEPEKKNSSSSSWFR
eukprot:TRINITY_DN23981_c0_g1_i1.p1 TRINITY_DN23981_c0_g1~~TRINITY_DN23981_c0_g1_i1.p1  ORF type:complete len:570 (+),score=54.87 TRINITY_DN23981_c0_g1_i1:70-1779(+)